MIKDHYFLIKNLVVYICRIYGDLNEKAFIIIYAIIGKTQSGERRHSKVVPESKK